MLGITEDFFKTLLQKQENTLETASSPSFRENTFQALPHSPRQTTDQQREGTIDVRPRGLYSSLSQYIHTYKKLPILVIL